MDSKVAMTDASAANKYPIATWSGSREEKEWSPHLFCYPLNRECL